MSGDGNTPRTMIEVLAQDKADAQQDQAILTPQDAPAPGDAYRKMMARQLGDETMHKMDEWLKIAAFETNCRSLAELLYEWTTGDCSVIHAVLYDKCEELMGEFALLLVYLGVVVEG